MKILPCNRCQHYIHHEGSPSQLSKCGHPNHQKIDYVTGSTEPFFCVNMRWKNAPCGPDGNLFAYDDAFPPAEEWEE